VNKKGIACQRYCVKHYNIDCWGYGVKRYKNYDDKIVIALSIIQTL